MDNLKYLKGVKGSDDIWHKNKKISFIDITKKEYYEYRKVKALEIIAEQMIYLNNVLRRKS